MNLLVKLATDPGMSDKEIILYLLERRGLLNEGETVITIVGTEYISPDKNTGYMRVFTFNKDGNLINNDELN